jgi:hypothetical protein
MEETTSTDPAKSAFLVGMALLNGQASAAPDDPIKSAKGAPSSRRFTTGAPSGLPAPRLS